MQQSDPPRDVAAERGVGRPVPERAHYEIRVEWCFGGNMGGGVWRADNDHNRKTLEAFVAAECALFGPSSHWIARRLA